MGHSWELTFSQHDSVEDGSHNNNLWLCKQYVN